MFRFRLLISFCFCLNFLTYGLFSATPADEAAEELTGALAAEADSDDEAVAVAGAAACAAEAATEDDGRELTPHEKQKETLRKEREKTRISLRTCPSDDASAEEKSAWVQRLEIDRLFSENFMTLQRYFPDYYQTLVGMMRAFAEGKDTFVYLRRNATYIAFLEAKVFLEKRRDSLDAYTLRTLPGKEDFFLQGGDVAVASRHAGDQFLENELLSLLPRAQEVKTLYIRSESLVQEHPIDLSNVFPNLETIVFERSATEKTRGIDRHETVQNVVFDLWAKGDIPWDHTKTLLRDLFPVLQIAFPSMISLAMMKNTFGDCYPMSLSWDAGPWQAAFPYLEKVNGRQIRDGAPPKPAC